MRGVAFRGDCRDLFGESFCLVFFGEVPKVFFRERRVSGRLVTEEK